MIVLLRLPLPEIVRGHSKGPETQVLGDGTFPILLGYISYRIRIVLYLNVF